MLYSQLDQKSHSFILLSIEYMPNMLAHFGVQGFLGHRFLAWCDPKWILIGCVIPDIPWILQRVVRLFALPVDLYDLRLYAICQASLFGCLVFAGALAFLSAHPPQIFGVLAINALAHLLLDSTQLKWANGVHLFAPFSWELWNLGWYWPESVVTYGLTALGVISVGVAWRSAIAQPLIPSLPSAKNGLVVGLCLVGYLVFPLYFMNQVEEADAHFIKTLRHAETRIGRAVEFDRVSYTKGESGGIIKTMSNEYLKVLTNPSPQSALVSIKGRFKAPDRIEVEDLHIHSSWFRDVASYLGLVVLLVLSLVSMVNVRGRKR